MNEQTQIDDGGPAFPIAQHLAGCDHENGCVNECPVVSLVNVSGMSLRDWFAGQAISGRFGFGETTKSISESAYELADSLIRERHEVRERISQHEAAG